MDKMIVKIPVTIKAKVTEALKDQLVRDLKESVKAADLNLKQLEFDAKRLINEQANQDESLLPILQQQIEAERQKRQGEYDELADRLKRAEKLEYGAEIPHGQIERSVEIEIGSNLESLFGAEIVVEDGVVIAFRA